MNERRRMAQRTSRGAPAPGLLDWALLGGTVALLLLPLQLGIAHAGVVTEDARSAFDTATDNAARADPAAPAASAAPRYQLRCWQYGQLVIEESGLVLPPEGPGAAGAAASTGAVRLRAADANHQPIYLTETRNAICLVRPLPGARTAVR